MYYLFYLLVLILPSLVFMSGLSLFVFSRIKNRVGAVSILLLVVLFVGYLTATSRFALLNPLGVTLPGAFSEITGHADLLTFVSQRIFWLLLGLLFVQLAALSFNRIPNNPKQSQEKREVFFCIGFIVLFGLILFIGSQKRMSHRATYARVYDKYAKEQKSTLLSQDIEYQQKGKRIEANSRISVQNQSAVQQQEIILYLNPGLKITSLKNREEELAYEREQQVICVKKTLAPGEITDLQLTYRGHIREEICYLDVPELVEEETRSRAYMTCHFGKRYAFLNGCYTLLIPEVLWYPVTLPPVNPGSVYNIPVNYSRFSLKVLNPKGKVVISQGDRISRGDTVYFRNECDLQGISLCIGDYEEKRIRVDSVDYTFYPFKCHASAFRFAGEEPDASMGKLIAGLKNKTEYGVGRDYPFDRFSLVETPVTFTSYYRNGHGRSEYVQPEMTFFPERGVGIPEDIRRLSLKTFDRFFSVNLIRANRIMQQVTPLDFFREQDLTAITFEQEINPHSLLPMFSDYLCYMHSDRYPVLNKVVNQMTEKNPEIFTTGKMLDHKMEQAAIRYLTEHSLEEALVDAGMSPEVLSKLLKLKSVDLLSWFQLNGIPRDSLIAFVADYRNRNLFKTMEFSHFDAAFKQQFDCSWLTVLPSWYKDKGVPSYLIKDFSATSFADKQMRQGLAPVQVRFSVFNDSEVDGMVYLYQSQRASYGTTDDSGKGMSSPDTEPIQVLETYSVKAGTGISVSQTFSCNIGYFITLNTNISHNLPTRLTLRPGRARPQSDSTKFFRSIDKHDFEPGKNEYIVDNEEAGFNPLLTSTHFGLSEYFSRNKKESSQYFDTDRFVDPNNKWYPYIDMKAYGLKIKSALFKPSGNGVPVAEWQVELEKPGKYELFIYVPNTVIQAVQKEVRPENLSKPQPQTQSYWIVSEDKKEEVSVKTFMSGWISLGFFELSAGKNKVVLTDAGSPNQIIYADAVKWVLCDTIL